jgi:hypothetical protein
MAKLLEPIGRSKQTGKVSSSLLVPLLALAFGGLYYVAPFAVADSLIEEQKPETASMAARMDAAEQLPDMAAPVGWWRKDFPEGQGTFDVAIRPNGTYIATLASKGGSFSPQYERTVIGRYRVKGKVIAFEPLHGPKGLVYGRSRVDVEGDVLTLGGADATTVLRRVRLDTTAQPITRTVAAN